MFPKTRHRRLRATWMLREAVSETRLVPQQLIQPFFVIHGSRKMLPIKSMPGQFQLSIDQLLVHADMAVRHRVGGVLLFGIPKKKDARGSEAYAENGIVQQAVRALKKKFPNLVIYTDLCFCEYTTHGHCGVLATSKAGQTVDNDATLKFIARTAVSQARAGAHFIAPSGMTDGAVATIRTALDKAGFKNTGILAYSAKYASAFYGPFRDAAGSTPKFGNRRSYQMDPANIREALREVKSDLHEGADIVMVKPALAYLDVVAKIKSEIDVPLAAYNVSGEYAMVCAAQQNGWLDGTVAAMEILMAIRRAGADLIISYFATSAAVLLTRE